MVRVSYSYYTLENGGSGYHTYDLLYDPTAGTADLFIDGTERLSDIWPIIQYAPAEVYFGNGTAAVGGANWNSVSFAIVPEPSTWGIALGGVALLAGIWSRRKRA